MQKHNHEDNDQENVKHWEKKRKFSKSKIFKRVKSPKYY
jgi:hypothetical protein